jgi:hypothetical protein
VADGMLLTLAEDPFNWCCTFLTYVTCIDMINMCISARGAHHWLQTTTGHTLHSTVSCLPKETLKDQTWFCLHFFLTLIFVFSRRALRPYVCTCVGARWSQQYFMNTGKYVCFI